MRVTCPLSSPYSCPWIPTLWSKVEDTARDHLHLLRNVTGSAAILSLFTQLTHPLIIPLALLATCFHFMARCSGQLDTLGKENSRLEQTSRELSGEVDRLSTQTREIAERNRELHQIRDALQNRVKDFEHTDNRLRESVRHLDDVRHQIHLLSEEIRRLNGEHARLNGELRRTTDALVRARSGLA